MKRILYSSIGCCFDLQAYPGLEKSHYFMSVNGKVDTAKMGITLSHEHILVDFKKGLSGEQWWDRDEVMKVMLPYLNELKNHGCRTFFEFTPSYIGKDVKLLKALADASDLQIVTNTGYYGARDNQFIPQHAYRESADQLAARWILEYRQGLQNTGIRPGFIKIGVNPGPLSTLHQKLIRAAGLTHLQTGLTIASHTGLSEPAFEEIEILKEIGVHPSAFIWTHAQNEEDLSTHTRAAAAGAWISLDNVDVQNVNTYVQMIKNLKQGKFLDKILLSHDAGWYTPGEEKGGKIRGYTAIFDYLIPALQKDGVTAGEIDQILVKNPARAFAIRVKKYRP